MKIIRKEITISQMQETSTTGIVPLSEPESYYLVINELDLNLQEAGEFVRNNMFKFAGINEEIISKLKNNKPLDNHEFHDVAMILAQCKISELHKDLPAKITFGSTIIDPEVIITGTKIECFGLDLMKKLSIS